MDGSQKHIMKVCMVFEMTTCKAAGRQKAQRRENSGSMLG